MGIYVISVEMKIIFFVYEEVPYGDVGERFYCSFLPLKYILKK